MAHFELHEGKSYGKLLGTLTFFIIFEVSDV